MHKNTMRKNSQRTKGTYKMLPSFSFMLGLRDAREETTASRHSAVVGRTH